MISPHDARMRRTRWMNQSADVCWWSEMRNCINVASGLERAIPACSTHTHTHTLITDVKRLLRRQSWRDSEAIAASVFVFLHQWWTATRRSFNASRNKTHTAQHGDGPVSLCVCVCVCVCISTRSSVFLSLSLCVCVSLSLSLSLRES